MKFELRKLVTASVAIVYFATHVVLAAPAEMNLWASRRQPLLHLSSQLSLRPLPVALPTVDVVLIQDVHQNQEAQKSIADFLLSVADKKMTVGVEGLFGPSGFDRFQAFDDKPLMKLLADYFLQENKISAPAYAAAVAEKSGLQFVGIDDAAHYAANVEAYRASQQIKGLVLGQVQKAQSDLQKQKANVLNPKLAEFDQKKMAHENDELGLGDYVSYLAHTYDAHDDLAIEQFLSAYELEKSLNFDRVEHERTRVMQALAEKLTKKDIELLVQQGHLYKAGQITFAHYFQTIRGLIDRHNISLAFAPSFHAYTRYLLLTETISADKLMAGVRNLENEILNIHCRTTRERMLMDASRRLYLTRQLLDFSLTPEEWEEYQLITKNQDPKFNSFHLKTFEAFYREADLRSVAMVNNLVLGSWNLDFPKPKVLVVGGFHAPLITKLLKKRGLTTAIVQAKITNVDLKTGTEYLSVFTREKSKLDQLFEGENLFLAPDFRTGHDQLAAAGAVYSSLRGSRFSSDMAGVRLETKSTDLWRVVAAGKTFFASKTKSLFGGTKMSPPGLPSTFWRSFTFSWWLRLRFPKLQNPFPLLITPEGEVTFGLRSIFAEPLRMVGNHASSALLDVIYRRYSVTKGELIQADQTFGSDVKVTISSTEGFVEFGIKKKKEGAFLRLLAMNGLTVAGIEVGQEIPITDSELKIGRAEQNHIVISVGEKVSRNHLEISVDYKNRILVLDKSTYGSKIEPWSSTPPATLTAPATREAAVQKLLGLGVPQEKIDSKNPQIERWIADFAAEYEKYQVIFSPRWFLGQHEMTFHQWMAFFAIWAGFLIPLSIASWTAFAHDLDPWLTLVLFAFGFVTSLRANVLTHKIYNRLALRKGWKTLTTTEFTIKYRHAPLGGPVKTVEVAGPVIFPVGKYLHFIIRKIDGMIMLELDRKNFNGEVDISGLDTPIPLSAEVTTVGRHGGAVVHIGADSSVPHEFLEISLNGEGHVVMQDSAGQPLRFKKFVESQSGHASIWTLFALILLLPLGSIFGEIQNVREEQIQEKTKLAHTLVNLSPIANLGLNQRHVGEGDLARLNDLDLAALSLLADGRVVGDVELNGKTFLIAGDATDPRFSRHLQHVQNALKKNQAVLVFAPAADESFHKQFPRLKFTEGLSSREIKTAAGQSNLAEITVQVWSKNPSFLNENVARDLENLLISKDLTVTMFLMVELQNILVRVPVFFGELTQFLEGKIKTHQVAASHA